MMRKSEWVKRMGMVLAAAALLASAAGCGVQKTKDSETAKTEAADTESKADTASTEAADAETAGGGTSDTEELQVVRIGGISQGDILNGSSGVAQKLGYFDEELEKIGYKSEIYGFQNGPAVNEAFASGSLDVAFMGDLPALVAKGKGVDSRIFTASGKETHYAILAQNDVEFNSLQDLEGKTVSVTIGTVLQYYFEQLLLDNGIDINKVNIVNDGTFATYESHDVDFLVTAFYYADAYEQQGKGKIVNDTLETPQYASQAFGYASSDYIAEHEDVIAAVYHALERVQEYDKENPQGYFEIFSESTGGTVPTSSLERSYVNDPEFESVNPAFTEECIDKLKALKDYALEGGLLAGDVDVDEWVYYVE